MFQSPSIESLIKHKLLTKLIKDSQKSSEDNEFKLFKSTPCLESHNQTSEDKLIPENDDGYTHFLDKLLKSQTEEVKLLKDSIIKKFKDLTNKELKNDRDNLVFDKHIYSVSNFPNFIEFVSAVIFYFSGIDSKFYIDERGNFDIDLYASEDHLQVLAENLRYRVQLRIIGETKLLDYSVKKDDENDNNEDNENQERLNDQMQPLLGNIMEEVEEIKTNVKNEFEEKKNEIKEQVMNKVSDSVDKIKDKLHIGNNADQLTVAKDNLPAVPAKFDIKSYISDLTGRMKDYLKDKSTAIFTSIKSKLNAENVTKAIFEKGKTLVDSNINPNLVDESNALNPIYQKNLVHIEDLEEDISNFPPYSIFKCSYQMQNNYKRFDLHDDPHICKLCEEKVFLKISQMKCKDDCPGCSQCDYNQYIALLESGENYFYYIEEEFKINEYTGDATHIDKVESNKNNSCSSVFRQIDKIRIIYYSLDRFFDVKKLKKEAEDNEENPTLMVNLWSMLDYDEYLKKFTAEISHDAKVDSDSKPKENSLIDSFVMSTSDSQNVSKFIYNMRDLYGEEVAFYFAWVSHYVFMLKYIAFYGMVLFLLTFTLRFFMDPITVADYDIYMIIPFTLFTVFVGKLFSEIWVDQEKIYAYKWGMQEYDLGIENSYLTEKLSYNFFLESKIPIIDYNKIFWRKLTTWVFCIFAYIAVIIANLLIFSFQFYFVSEYIDDFNNDVAGFVETLFVYFILIFSLYCFLKIRNSFSQIFFKQVKKLTIKEEHPTAEDHNSNLTFKVVCFEIVNYYFNLYYTAFVKGYFQSCLFNDCRAEIGFQLNAMYLIFLIEDLLAYREKQNSFKSEASNDDNKSTKNHHYSRGSYSGSVNEEYMQIILVYGYLIQFGAASPISLMIAFAHGMFARYTDSVRFAKLIHVNFISKLIVFNKLFIN